VTNGAGTEPITGEKIRAIPARHPMRWVATVLVLFLATLIAIGFATNKNIQWGIVKRYFGNNQILHGVVETLVLTALAMAVGVILGIMIAVMRLSPVPVVSSVSWFYVWVFRGTPVLVQLLFWYNVALFTGGHPAVGIPFTHVVFFHVQINNYIGPFTAAVLGFGLNEAAYMAEIVRAGILSVGEGQVEAAQSIGMTRIQTMRSVVLPQAMRVIIPPTGNETISMLKLTSVGSVIAVPELLNVVERIGERTFQIIPLLMVASIWYLAMTSVLTVGQFYVERHYARSALRQLPPTPFQRFRALLTRNVIRVRPQPIGVPLGREHN
jgi:polar amino acid transport system permease protein